MPRSQLASQSQGQGQDEGQDLHEVSSLILEAKDRPRRQDCYPHSTPSISISWQKAPVRRFLFLVWVGIALLALLWWLVVNRCVRKVSVAINPPEVCRRPSVLLLSFISFISQTAELRRILGHKYWLKHFAQPFSNFTAPMIIVHVTHVPKGPSLPFNKHWFIHIRVRLATDSVT